MCIFLSIKKKPVCKMGVHRDALPLNSLFSILQSGFYRHQRPPSCQIQWPLFHLPSYLTALWFRHCLFFLSLEHFSPLSSIPSPSLDFLFAFGRLCRIIVKSPQSHGVCSSASSAACLLAGHLGDSPNLSKPVCFFICKMGFR